jgi:putative ABC transport system permease protein
VSWLGPAILLREFGYAGRGLRRNPGFAAAAALTIGLGLGASTAIFSVAHAVLLRPLPYKDPERLVFAVSDLRKRDVKDFPFSNADFIDVRDSTATVFEQVGAVNTGRTLVPREDGSLEQVRRAAVTPDFFRLMGGVIAVGRDFTDEDGRAQPAMPPAAAGPATPPPRLPAVAILSYEYWQRRFGKDPAVIGRGMPGARPGGTQIVGVLAPGFELLFPPDANMERTPDVWYAARLAYDNANRNNVSWRLIGRLKPGVSLERAQAKADATAAALRSSFTIKETAGFQIRLEPMHRHVVAGVRPAILALMGAATFLLLIACSNVANLLLVRACARDRDVAVRTALGGSWWRLVTLSLAESLLLAVGGVAAGVGLAWAGIQQLRAIAPANLPRLDAVRIDPTAVAFAAMTAVACAAIFGCAQALRALRPDVARVLRSSGRAAAPGNAGLLRAAAVIAEVGLSFVLLVGSGLMIRSFVELQRIDPGFTSRGLLTFHLLGGGRRTDEENAAFQRDLRRRLSALPGVESVTAATPFPLAGGFSPIRWGLEAALTDPSRFQAADFQFVLPGYFETMRTPLLAGRTFTDADNTPERSVAIIDQALAAKAFPNEPAVGKRILTRIRTPEAEWVEVIGVVAHQRAASLAEPGREQIYFTDGFVGHGAVSRWAIRTAGDPAALADAVRAEIGKLGPRVALAEIEPMDALVGRAKAGTRFSLLLISVFAAIAALLAGIGLYGVLSTLVRQRTPEIGVRMALGAEPSSIFNLVVGHGLRLSLAGIAAGLAAAYALTRVMAGMLVGVRPTDPATFAAIPVMFLIISALAAWLPARRAAGLDPAVALREE